MKVNIIVDTTWLCFRLSNIVFFCKRLHLPMGPDVFGEILTEILHIVMIELLI